MRKYARNRYLNFELSYKEGIIFLDKEKFKYLKEDQNTLKNRILNLFLILSSFVGYLEWGKDGKMILLQGEIDIFIKIFTDPLSVLHPFIIIPLLGQIIIVSTLFQKRPSKYLTFAGIGCIALLILLITFISVIDLNYKMFLSTLPFIIVSVITILHHKK